MEPNSPADPVDQLVRSWARARPDLSFEPMALIARLNRFVRLAERRMEATFAAHGLTMADFDVLSAIVRTGDGGCSAGHLAAAMMLSPSGVTGRLDRLEGAGLVTRTPDPHDRRALHVVLTPTGRDLVDRSVTDHLATETDLLSPLADRERAQLGRLLTKLLDPLSAPG